MALDQSVPSELLAAFQSSEGLDLIRESVRLVCQDSSPPPFCWRRVRPPRVHWNVGST